MNQPIAAASVPLSAPAGAAVAPVPRWARSQPLLWAGFLAAFTGLEAATGFADSADLSGVPWDPPGALAVALVALVGRRVLSLVLVACILAELLTRSTGVNPAATLIMALGTAGAYCVGGLAVRRWSGWTRADAGVRDLTALVLISLLTALLWACAHVLGFGIDGQLAAERVGGALLLLTSAQLVALVFICPLLFQLAGRIEGRRGSAPSALQAALASVVFMALVTAILFMVFGVQAFDGFRMSYLLLLPVIAVSMRFGLGGAAVAVPLMQVCLVVALSLVSTHSATAFEYQLLMLCIGLTALYVGALSSERDRTAAQASRNEAALREQAAALSEAQRTASTAELAAALAHDLNQPLSAIGTYARASRLLAERGGDDETLLGTLRQIEQESARAGQYVRRMRDFFRTGTINADRLSAAALVDNARALLQDRLTREHIGWHSEIAPGVGHVRADSVQVGAVFGNLLGNACDALARSAGPRQIELRVTRVPQAEPPLVRFAVSDSGPGVPPEQRDQLFKPLETTKPHGMGLGLALSRSIAERQGGRLWFDLAAPRTTFCLDLPADDPAPAARPGAGADEQVLAQAAPEIHQAQGRLEAQTQDQSQKERAT